MRGIEGVSGLRDRGVGDFQRREADDALDGLGRDRQPAEDAMVQGEEPVMDLAAGLEEVPDGVRGGDARQREATQGDALLGVLEGIGDAVADLPSQLGQALVDLSAPAEDGVDQGLVPGVLAGLEPLDQVDGRPRCRHQGGQFPHDPIAQEDGQG